MFGAYTTARGMALSRLVIRFFWCGLASVFVTYVYMWVLAIHSCNVLLLVIWAMTSYCYNMYFVLSSFLFFIFNCRKVLEEQNQRNSNSKYFRIYILALGIYAAVRVVFALLLKCKACHTLSDMSDQSFFQFFKWIYQVFYCLISLILRRWSNILDMDFLNMFL